MRVRSPVDIMYDFRMLQLNNFEDYEEVKRLRRDVKALLKNMREYVAYLVESGQPSLTEGTDRDILEFEDVSRKLFAIGGKTVISYKIVSEDGRKSAARMYHDEKIIEFGCNMNYINKAMQTDRVFPFFKQFKNIEEYYEKCIDALITHEIIHSIIHPSEGDVASRCFDNVDSNHEISSSLDPKDDKEVNNI